MSAHVDVGITWISSFDHRVNINQIDQWQNGNKIRYLYSSRMLIFHQTAISNTNVHEWV